MSIETPTATATPGAMLGLMQPGPLLVSGIANYAEALFANVEVVSPTATEVERSTYGNVTRRARKLASALHKAGIRPGDRVATFGWNSVRHLELYLAVPSLGAVLHTLNIRLFEEDLQYIVDHAEDRIVFLDASLATVMPVFPRVEQEIVMPDAPGASRDGALGYEEFLASGDDDFVYPVLDENQAAAMCYTSGTTGRPKGVVYSHRSISLHALLVNQPTMIGLDEQTTAMAVVPMFHAMAWGMPYAAALAGSKLVLPGPRMDPRSLADLIDSEQVTYAAGVPTIWQGIAQLDPKPSLTSVKELLGGGSAVPESLIRTYRREWGIPIIQGWGMTETSPLATVNRPRPGDPDGDEGAKRAALQGRPAPFVEIRLDAEAGGEVQIHGPTVAAAYYRSPESAEKFTDDGWLRTGDVAEIEDGFYVKLVDRTKDLVKSGGEWISSVELENEIMGHPDVLEAAVVAVPDEKWSERPCACVVRRDGSGLDADGLRSFLAERVAKWWLPDRVEFITEVPKTSVGKFDKKVLRAHIAEGTLNSAA